MTTGKHDTKFMKELTGSRLKAARDGIPGMRDKISRQKLVDTLNSREDRPVIGDKKAELSLETLKKWEYGENPINIEWLPVICDVLDCDIGYLFGEYEERRRETSDACRITGLSEICIERLRWEEGSLRKKQLEEILLDNRFWEIINCFCQWQNVSKGILEEKKKESEMFMELIKSGQYPDQNEYYRRISDMLVQSARNYEIDKYHCSRLFDEIRDKFLPDVKV